MEEEYKQTETPTEQSPQLTEETTVQSPPEELEVPLEEIPLEEKIATKKDILDLSQEITSLFDAVKELTKTCASLNEEWAKWRKAGKF